MERQDQTSCGSLLRELQRIWDEVGESDVEREKMLLQAEQECMDVYRRKVEQARNSRLRLEEALADSEAELVSLITLLGDRPPNGKFDKGVGMLKDQLAAIQPQLAELRQKKEERMQQFVEVKKQIQRISGEILGYLQPTNAWHQSSEHIISEQDLSLRRLDEYHQELQSLQEEKRKRLHRVLDYIDTIHELCAVLGMDFLKTIRDVDPSLDESTSSGPKSISNDTLESLGKIAQSLRQEKKCRVQKFQDLGASLVELWNLMDTSFEEKERFSHITSLIGASANDVRLRGALGIDNIEQTEAEVKRLDQLKASKMKELVLKKQKELDQIYASAHMEPDPNSTLEKMMAIIDSGVLDPSDLLANMDQQIAEAKAEALSRKDIMEKIERWIGACEEESWLDDYNRDENRYTASRGAHINLKRAERARATVNKIPALIDNLMAKTKAWEDERGILFLFDGIRLLDMLEEYNYLRQEKEEEKKRIRDQKRLQDHLMSEKETMFGPRPSPSKPLSAKKVLNVHGNANSASGTPASRRMSLAGDMLVSKVNGVTPIRPGKEGKKEKGRLAAPVNFVPLTKEGWALSSINGSEPASPMLHDTSAEILF